MRITLLTIAIAALVAPGVRAQVKQPPYRVPLLLEIAARGYTAGEKAASMAGDSAVDKIESYVWADRTLCAMGAGNTPPQNVPWVGWHVTGTVSASAPENGRDALGIRVEWQRLWENGVRVQDGPKGLTITPVRAGERIQLDRIVAAEAGGCGTVQVRLELGVITKPAYRLGVAGVGAGAGAAGGQGGAGAGTGGRGAITRDTLALVEPVLRGKVQGAVTVPGSYDAEIWMVHRHPDGTETVQQQTVRFTGADQAFTFPPVVVPTANGEITLDIGGTLRAAAGPVKDGAGALRLVLVISRRARAGGPPPLDTRGGSYLFLDIPASSDVLSFELPSLQKATEDLLKGHTFSLRIRVVPVPR